MPHSMVSPPSITPLIAKRHHYAGADYITADTYIQIETDSPCCELYFTTDGHPPDPFNRFKPLSDEERTFEYRGPFKLRPGRRTVMAVALNRSTYELSRKTLQVFAVSNNTPDISLINDQQISDHHLDEVIDLSTLQHGDTSDSCSVADSLSSYSSDMSSEVFYNTRKSNVRKDAWNESYSRSRSRSKSPSRKLCNSSDYVPYSMHTGGLSRCYDEYPDNNYIGQRYSVANSPSLSSFRDHSSLPLASYTSSCHDIWNGADSSHNHCLLGKANCPLSPNRDRKWRHDYVSQPPVGYAWSGAVRQPHLSSPSFENEHHRGWARKAQMGHFVMEPSTHRMQKSPVRRKGSPPSSESSSKGRSGSSDKSSDSSRSSSSSSSRSSSSSSSKSNSSSSSSSKSSHSSSKSSHSSNSLSTTVSLSTLISCSSLLDEELLTLRKGKEKSHKAKGKDDKKDNNVEKKRVEEKGDKKTKSKEKKENDQKADVEKMEKEEKRKEKKKKDKKSDGEIKETELKLTEEKTKKDKDKKSENKKKDKDNKSKESKAVKVSKDLEKGEVNDVGGKVKEKEKKKKHKEDEVEVKTKSDKGGTEKKDTKCKKEKCGGTEDELSKLGSSQKEIGLSEKKKNEQSEAKQKLKSEATKTDGKKKDGKSSVDDPNEKEPKMKESKDKDKNDDKVKESIKKKESTSEKEEHFDKENKDSEDSKKKKKCSGSEIQIEKEHKPECKKSAEEIGKSAKEHKTDADDSKSREKMTHLSISTRQPFTQAPFSKKNAAGGVTFINDSGTQINVWGTSTEDIVEKLEQFTKKSQKGLTPKDRNVKSSEKYQKLVKHCHTKGSLWNDSDFPAESDTAYFNQHLTSGKVEWKRPKEINEKMCMFAGRKNDDGIVCGIHKRCLLSSVVFSIGHHHPSQLYRLVSPDQSSAVSSSGVVRCLLWYFGQWVEVCIDDRLPTCGGKLVGLHSKQNGDFWAALLEKACAKMFGSYEALHGAPASEVMTLLTGGLAEPYYFREELPDDMFDILQNATKTGSLICCSIEGSSHGDKMLESGLLVGQNYLMTDTKQVSMSSGRKVKVVKLHLTPGCELDKWSQQWVQRLADWKYLAENDRKYLQCHSAGQFWMDFRDFITYFHRTEICYWSPEQPQGEQKSSELPWHSAVFRGCWRQKVNAGGDRSHKDTYWINPCYHLCIKACDDDDNEGLATVIIGLQQQVHRKLKTPGCNLHAIGYNIYEMPGGNCKILDKSFFESHLPVSMTSRSHCEQNEVCLRHRLSPGDYCIVPSTRNVNEEADFLLRIYSEKQSSVIEIDEETQFTEKHLASDMTTLGAEAEAAFREHSNKNLTIGAHQLQGICSQMCSKYNKGNSFDLNLCRSLIAIYDTTNTGKLDYDEFLHLWINLSMWKKAYKQSVSNDHSITSFHLRPALKRIGFQLSNAVFSSIASRYSDADGTVSFGDFVTAISRLHALYDSFTAKHKFGSTKAELDEFLLHTVLY